MTTSDTLSCERVPVTLKALFGISGQESLGGVLVGERFRDDALGSMFEGRKRRFGCEKL